MSAIPRNDHGAFLPEPGQFDRAGFRAYLKMNGAAAWYVRDIPSRLKRVERTIGAGRFADLDPHRGEIREALRDAPDFQKLHRVVQWQLIQAAEDYEQFLIANDLDEKAFRTYLTEIGQTAVSVRDNVARVMRLRRLMGVQPFVELVARQDDLTQALEKTDTTTAQRDLSTPIRHQIRRAVTYYLFHVNGWPTTSLAFPAQRRQNAPKTNHEEAVDFDREGFKAYLEGQGISGKRLSDRLAHISRVARLAGADAFSQMDKDPFQIKDALERAASQKGISNDVLGQLLRALRDYAFYRYSIDPENPDDWVLAITRKNHGSRPGRPKLVTDRPQGSGTRHRRRRKRNDPPRNADGTPMSKQAIEQQRQAQIQRFLQQHGAKQCPSKTANGAVLLENLGLD